MNEKLGVEHIAGLKWMLKHDYVHQMDRAWVAGVIKELEAEPVAATHSEDGREVPRLNASELENLQDFYAAVCDDSGHRVEKSGMRRLAEIGAVESVGFGKHRMTEFGTYLLGINLAQPARQVGGETKIPWGIARQEGGGEQMAFEQFAKKLGWSVEWADGLPDYADDEVEMMWTGWKARAALAPAAVVSVQICKLGAYGKAFDLPSEARAYSYEHQPDNGGAYKLGTAASAARVMSAGDSIDAGLNLLKALAGEGFGVFELRALLGMEGE